ncbi:MAG: HEAT repeat domain-containing protein [Polyangiales bacterium]
MKTLIRFGTAALAMVGVLALGAPKAKTAPTVQDTSHEVLPTGDDIMQVAVRGAPIAVWETLEHGESLECLDCISYVKPLLYDKDARVREIAAWWLRRRVFGYATVALEVRKTVIEDADPTRRAAAANALGEFLDPGATPLLIKAAADTSPVVRVAALSAIKRLNDADGAPAVSKALTDGDISVRRVAIDTAVKLSGFADVAAVATLLGDADPVIRSHAADALGVFKAKGSVAGLSAIAATDPDEEVRIDAVNALGEIGDPAARPAIEKALGDASSRVRDAARIASLKLAS